jgi:hypothetical protein
VRFQNFTIHPFAVFLLCTLPLWVYGVLCGSTGHDDAHINFWSVWTLLEHGEILNYNGERLEQTTSLTLDALTALYALVTPLSIITGGYLANLTGAFVTVALTYMAARRVALPHPWLPALLTALTPYFTYWAWSGMETTLAAACALAFIISMARYAERTSTFRVALLLICATLLAAARPEMPVVGVAFLFIAAIFLRRPALLIFILPFAALTLWRHYYFGAWLPNPVYAKSGLPDAEQLQRGVNYFLRLFRQPLAAIGVTLTLILFSMQIFSCIRQYIQPNNQQHTQQPLLLLCCLWVMLYGSFVITSGGDWMKEGRFWVPLVAPLWLVIHSVITPKTSAALLVLLCGYTPFFIKTFSFGTPLWQYAAQKKLANADASFFEIANREHLRDWPALQALQHQLRLMPLSSEKPLTLMSKQMGMVNYHLFSEFGNTLRVWDMAGLVDNTLRNCAVMAQDGFDKQGLRINYRKFFDRLPQATRECDMEAPDIIYDIYGWGENTPLPEFLRTQGYTILFNQTGRVNIPLGIDITAQETVAIKSSLLAADKTINTITVDFNQYLSQP